MIPPAKMPIPVNCVSRALPGFGVPTVSHQVQIKDFDCLRPIRPICRTRSKKWRNCDNAPIQTLRENSPYLKETRSISRAPALPGNLLRGQYARNYKIPCRIRPSSVLCVLRRRWRRTGAGSHSATTTFSSTFSFSSTSPRSDRVYGCGHVSWIPIHGGRYLEFVPRKF
jgi:hypothetical protein